MKFIDEWKKAHKMLSVQLAVIGASFCGFISAFPDAALHAWNLLPVEWKTALPPRWLPLIGSGFFLIAIIARLVKQPKLNVAQEAADSAKEETPG
jgi:hypothetical protein